MPAQASLSAVTTPATDVTSVGATLRGTVDPSGSTPSYYFEYGLTSAYGAQTPAVPFKDQMKVQAAVAGLMPATTYHFRVVAKRDDRAVRGADQSFTTPSLSNGGDLVTPVTDPLSGLPVTGGSTGGKDGSSGTGSGSNSGSGTNSGSGSSSGSGGTNNGSRGDSNSGAGGDTSGSGSTGSGGSGDDDDPSSGDSGEQGDDDGVTSPDGAASTAPVLGTTVGAAPESGSIRVRPPGESTFVPLDDGTPIPVGSIVDSRRGAVRIVTAVGDGGDVQAATFHGAVFKVRQREASGGLTDLVLKGGDFAACHANFTLTDRIRPAGARARLQARAARTRRPVRRLWGRDHHGRFRTHGRGSIATVRGTTWAVADYCDGTRTSVRSGAVLVHDNLRHRTVLVRAGHSYFARTAR